MGVPKYNELMKPIMEVLSDGKVYVSKDLKAIIAKKIGLSEDDLREKLASNKNLFASRLSWAVEYLRQSGLIINVSRGTYKITGEGIKALPSMPEVVNKDYLNKFASFRAFLARTVTKSDLDNDKSSDEVLEDHDSEDNTPIESIEKSIKKVNDALADELITTVMDQSPYFFEELVIDLLQKMLYGDSDDTMGFVTQKSGDEGVDGYISLDKFGFEKIYVQAKRFKEGNNVGRQTAQSFLGAVAGQGAKKGLLITTSDFTREAKDFVAKQLDIHIVLINGTQLAKYMIDYRLGVTTEKTYEIKHIDMDYFSENE